MSRAAGENRDFNPASFRMDYQVAASYLEPLLRPDDVTMEPGPGLAESWEMASAGRDITYRLREGVRWHDGRPFTADDVLFTFDYFRRAPTGRWTHHVSEVPEVAQVTALDARTVRLRCAYVCPYLGSITLADLPIIPRHVWESTPDPKKREGLPVGTGPYRLAAYEAGRSYRFEANPDYFGGTPRVRRLTMPIISDPNTTFTALRSGEVDAAVRPVPPELVDRFRGDSALGLVPYTPLAFPQLVLNYERAPFDVPAVRKAIDLGVDRRQLLDVVWLGQGRPADRGYPHPDSPWSDPTLRTPSDPAAARAALDGAGLADRTGDGVRELPDGRPLAFAITVAGNEPTYIRAAELLVEQFRALGATVRIDRTDAGTISSLNTSREFDAQISEIGAHGVADPTQFFMSHRSGYLWDLPRRPYPEIEAVFREWQSAPTLEAGLPLLHRAQQIFTAAPTAIPLVYPEKQFAYRADRLAGWRASPGIDVFNKWSLLAPRP